MAEAVRFLRSAVLQQVRPGVKQDALSAAYREAIRETGFRATGATDMHSYGLDVPERPSRNGAGWNERVEFTLQPGMVYSISPAVMAPDSEDVVIGGSSLVVTDDGYRELGSRPIELLSIED
jgi:Xaa-Pro aminopeptidase